MQNNFKARKGVKNMNMIKKIGLGVFALGAMLLGATTHAADFDSASTTQMVNDAIANVTPTLSSGVVKVIGVALGIWVVFFLIGKLRKHTR